MDVYIQFPNGLKRPDISIFCQEPSEEEQDSVLTRVPEAVVEVVSKGYEAKVLDIGLPFYLSQGSKMSSCLPGAGLIEPGGRRG